jgi:Chaperone of endosialidase
MPNTPITPPRVPVLDPRTGLIDRAWYMFFLSLFQSATTNENVPDVAPSNTAVQDEVGELAKQLQSGLVGPDNAGVAEQVSEISKQLQSALVGPANAGVISQIGELAKQFQSTQLGPTNSALLEQIAALRNEVQAFYLLPPNQPSTSITTGGVTSVDGSGGTTGLTLTGGPITSTGTLTLGGTLAVANGGTGTATPSLVAGTNVSITGSWPNQTINSTGGGSGMVYPSAGIANSTGAAWGSSYSTTGSGTVVALATSPTFVTPILGTPQSGNFSTGTFIWPTFNQNTTGNAATATNVAYSGLTGTVPTWNQNTTGTAANVTGVVAVANGGTGLTTAPANGALDIGNGTGFTRATLTAGSGVTITNSAGGISIAATGSGGTVTSVTGTSPVVSSGGTTPAISLAANYGDTQTPYAAKTANYFLAAPNGFAGTPSFRGILVSDIPTLNQNTTGTAANVTGVVAIANGGTGSTSLAGAGIVTITGTQTVTGDKTFNSQNNVFTGTKYSTSDGTTSNGYLFENTSYAALGGTYGVVFGSGAYPGTGRIVVDNFGSSNTLRPYADNVTTLGTSGSRYTVVYATTGTINTSDATEKQQVRELDDAERRTAQRVKGLIRAFKWNEAVESKGDGARIHFGVMAQDVEAAFAAEGLDATKYGLFCRDTWDTLDGQPQTRLGVRYEELLAFVIAAL